MTEENNNPEEINEEQEVEQTEEEKYQEEYDKAFYAEDGDDSEDTGHSDDTGSDGESGDADEEPDGEEGAEPDNEDGEEAPVEEEEQVTLVWRGKEITVPKSDAIAMAQQNFDITQKYQEVANLRKQTERELELIERVKEGDKEALVLLAKEGNIDPIDLLDVDADDIEQGSGKPTEPFVSPEVDRLMQEVSRDEVLYGKLAELERVLPAPVVSTMAKDLNTFYTVINEVQSGDADIVMPHVQARIAQLSDIDRSLVMSNPDAFAQLYVNVKGQLAQQVQPPAQGDAAPKANRQKRKVNPADVAVRKTGTNKNRQVEKLDSMTSDSAYQKILDRLNSQM